MAFIMLTNGNTIKERQVERMVKCISWQITIGQVGATQQTYPLTDTTHLYAYHYHPEHRRGPS